MMHVVQFSAIDTILYLRRRLTHSATMKKANREVKIVWNGIIVVEGGGWRPIFMCLCGCGCLLFGIVACGFPFPLCSCFSHSTRFNPSQYIFSCTKIKNYRYSILLPVMLVTFRWLVTVPSFCLLVSVLPCKCRHLCNFLDSIFLHTSHTSNTTSVRVENFRSEDILYFHCPVYIWIWNFYSV